MYLDICWALSLLQKRGCVLQLMFLLFHLLTAEEIAKEVENNERLKNQMGSKQKPVCITVDCHF